MWPHEAYPRFEMKIKNTQVLNYKLIQQVHYNFNSNSNLTVTGWRTAAIITSKEYGVT